MAKYSKMEAMRGRRIELRNLLRPETHFRETRDPLPLVQKIGILLVSPLLLCVAVSMVGVSIFLAYQFEGRVARPWGIAVVLVLFVLVFFLGVGLLTLASKKIRRTAAEIPPKH